MQEFLIKKFLFPLHEKLLNRPTLKALRELESLENLTFSQIREYQWLKLKSLIRHAYHNVPYYRYHFDHLGCHPEDLKSWDDFFRLPFLTKNKIRENIGSLKAANLKPVDFIRMNTGGSTGEPLIFYVDRRRVAYDRAAHLRSRRWWGIDIGEREAVIWGSPIELSAQDRLKEFRDLLFNTKLLSAFRMDEKTMRDYILFLKRYKPKHIFGYASSIYLLSRFAETEGFSLRNLGVKSIFVTADTLYDYQRETISRVFSCPVANGYGGRDLGFVAHECPFGSMHVTEDIIVEILRGDKPAPPGELGEIVVTHLDNYAMPFIRYRSGDLAILGKDFCNCGRNSLVLIRVEGRATDFVVTPTGKIMHALSLIYILRDLSGIKSFKIIQENKELFRILVVKDRAYSLDLESVIRQEINKLMEKPVEIIFEYVDEIPPEKSGKYRYVVSKVSIPWLMS